MTRAILALGSNLGDRHQHLADAVRQLGDSVLVVSGVYETPPWPPREHADRDRESPNYLNAVVLVADDIEPRGWLIRAQALEQAAGRERDPGWRHAPRTLDVDVIAVWADNGEPVTSDDPDFTVPHPRAHLRAFVLRPWLDIAPYAQLPGLGPVTDLLRDPSVRDDLGEIHPRPDLTLPA